ncbi:hypothetical protein [Candidatus Uabimicrobium amorphum]|uniref:Uncharacterized protein n=1 Tax=Uabimicrobium amorphum TaxID=2596890 RepID=A0A5S9F6B3_UABAM|nr:hypothetical protein [Candidatus Uabimicrobium amorphum]BBM86434.1 hypothetical protein UABAM_04820 [Candidatus Uabimicrobium amorphum]
MIRYILFTLLLTSIAFANLTIYPRNVQMKSGSTLQFTVVSSDRDGNAFTPRNVSWSSNYGSVSSGWFTAPSRPATYTVTARWKRYSASATVTVKQPYNQISKIVVTPQNQRVEVNKGVYFKAVAYDTYGRVVQLKSAKWWADGGNIDQNGYYRAGYRPGYYTVWVQDTYSGQRGSAKVQVVRQVIQPPLLYRIVVTPRSKRIQVGASLQLTAVGYDKFNRVVPFKPKWFCDRGSISNSGYYQAPRRPGYVNIWVQDRRGTAKGTANIEVVRSSIPGPGPNPTPGRVYKIVITPRNQRVAVGRALQFTAIGYDRYNRVIKFTPRWWCDGGTVRNGYYQAGNRPGTYNIGCSDNYGIKAQTTVIVVRNTIPGPGHGHGKARIDVTLWDVNRGNLFSRSRVKTNFVVYGRKAHKVSLFGIYPTGKVVELITQSCSNGSKHSFKEKYSYNITRLELRVYNSYDEVIAKYSASGR